MKKRKVRVVWLRFEYENGTLSKQRLIVSTLSHLMPQQMFIYYAKKWSIEDLFNQMKNRWGWKGPGYLHHIIQRGVRSLDIFYKEQDRVGVKF